MKNLTNRGCLLKINEELKQFFKNDEVELVQLKVYEASMLYFNKCKNFQLKHFLTDMNKISEFCYAGIENKSDNKREIRDVFLAEFRMRLYHEIVNELTKIIAEEFVDERCSKSG